MERIRIPAESVHETLRRYMLLDGLDIVLDLEKSRGSLVRDARTGKEYIDFLSFFASQPIGLNHARMSRPETVEFLGRIALHKPSNSDIYTREMAEFVETFARLAKPEPFRHLFFIEGGALAIENALKTAFDWKVQKNLARGKGEKGTRVIHFTQCFHGRTGYTMSMTDSHDPRKTRLYPKFEWPRITSPVATFPLEGRNLEAVVEAERRAVGEIQATLRADPEGIAALIIEPIQGEGGDNHFRGEFLRELRRICDENEILLIFDEIQTGLGLTGKMWCCEHFGVTPDILAFGKKTQVCGIMVSERIDEVEENVFKVASRLNSTWGGNLVDMLRCRMHLEIIHEERLVERAREEGVFLLRRLEEMQADLNGLMQNARGRGLMCAFTLADGVSRQEILRRIFDAGILMLPCGRHSIRFRPVLDIPRDILAEGLRRIEQVLKEVAAGTPKA